MIAQVIEVSGYAFLSSPHQTANRLKSGIKRLKYRFSENVWLEDDRWGLNALSAIPISQIILWKNLRLPSIGGI
jgi:hypothetical protein